MRKIDERDLKNILIDSVKKFKKDDPIRMAGALSFFTIFAIPPVLLVIITVAGSFLGKETVKGELYTELNKLVGSEGALLIENILTNYTDTGASVGGLIFGALIFIIASTTFFIIIQRNFNDIWKVKPEPKSKFLFMLKNRAQSFGIIVSLGFVLLVSLAMDALLGLMQRYLSEVYPLGVYVLLHLLNFLISFSLVSLVFMLLYKFLPDVKLKYQTALVGGVLTAALFTIGKYIIGLALGGSDISSMYGAAGSVAILLLWVFYSSLILFFGAEITYQYSRYISDEVEPEDYAVKVEKHEKIER